MLNELLGGAVPWTAIVISAGLYYWYGGQPSPFPIINSHPNDFLGRKAQNALQQRAGEIIREGLATFGGPVSIRIPYGLKIVLPANLAGWVKSNKDLDHRELVKEDFAAGYHGFEAQTTLHSQDEVLKTIIRSKMSSNASIIPVINKSLSKGLSLLWGNPESWHTLNWYPDSTGIITRAACSVFVGPEKAEDPEWLELVQSYVGSFFSGVSDLNSYPRWSRFIMQWFIPNAATCRKLVARARVIMNEVVAQRQEEELSAERDGRPRPQYNDALFWSQEVGASAEPGDVQLALMMASTLTTAEVFRHVLLELARDASLAEAVREEVIEQTKAHGVTLSALTNMVLLDSVLKEAQRLASGQVVLERMALKDTKLPSGQVIPQGSHIMVDGTNLWDPAVYPEPNKFDGYRFFRRRQDGDSSVQFVQSSTDFHVFGGGRHICPGRFLANNILKLALSHVVLKYDLRLEDEGVESVVPYGFYTIINPMAQVEVRRKTTDDGFLDL